MALKFQYNKVAMQNIQKELKMRENALPTLKSKEAYLRITIKKQKQMHRELENELLERRSEIQKNERLWAEFPESIVRIQSVRLKMGNVAGIKVPDLDDIVYDISPRTSFLSPAWLPWGIETARELKRKVVEIAISLEKVEKLEYARKKTTQKVNLYEKVQIPEHSDAILKIKRYLEDAENLDKAAQKITKSRQEAEAQTW